MNLALLRTWIVSLVVIMSLSHPALAQAPTETPEQRDARMKWWRDARFGMFIHWGLYAIPGGEWQGKKVNGIGEWIMNNGHIPVADYERLAAQFNPVKFDAKKWVKIAGDAGMRYMVITSKHHDGFCLWDSKVSTYDVMDATPFKRDILRELADACKADGRVRLCFYHSIMDWHHPDAQSIHYPTYNTRDKKNPNFPRYVEEYLKPQLKELITGYDPAVLWFDGEWVPDYTEEMGHDIYNFCKQLKPDIIINNRVGKSRAGMAGMSKSKESAGDFGTPEQEIPATGLPGVDWESCMTMNNTWGFRKDDNQWKSGETLIRNLVDVVSKGGNYLLNVGPTPEGEIPEPSVQRLAEIGKWMSVNGESIHGAQASPFKKLAWGRATMKPGKLYLHVFQWPANGNLAVPTMIKLKGGASLLADSSKNFQVMTGGGQTVIAVPAGKAPDAVDTVVVLPFDGTIEAGSSAIRQESDGTLKLLAVDADVQGQKARIEKKGENPYNIGYWTNKDDKAVWQAAIDKAGKYAIEVEYSLDKRAEGAEYVIQFNDKSVLVKPEVTGTWTDFKTVKVGEVELPAGTVTVTVRGEKKPGQAVLDLRGVTLKPAG
jgi:alpha-L-fucosidase